MDGVGNTERVPNTDHYRMNATDFLQQQLGVLPQEEPSADTIRGLLYTSDYQRFQIYRDAGDLIYTFEGAKSAHRCLPGDHVAWDAQKGHCILELRDEHPMLVGTLELTNKTRYGLTKRKHPMVLFTPYDKRYPPLIVGTSEKDLSCNRVALVKLDEWDEGALFPRGHLQHILGPSGDHHAETLALIHQACPWTYRPQEVNACRPTMDDRLYQGLRVPLTGMTFHVDPAGCRDVDDVITLSPLPTGGWTVTISISDVAGYVEDGGAVDLMASLIGQTLYDTDGAVLRPMLPAPYSEEACSLLPGKVSYAVSLQLEWEHGAVQRKRWLLTTLTTDVSYTYEAFQAEDTVYRTVVAELATWMAGAAEPITDAHEWIAQMMIYYNKEVGAWLKSANQGGILRRHAAPQQERLARLAHLPQGASDLRALAFSSAEYCMAEEKETDHYGLATDAYAHASSPIRRYADLVNQRILKHLIAGQTTWWIVPVTMVELNRRDKANRRFARDKTFLDAFLSSPHRVFRAWIVETCAAVTHGYQKVRFYVPEWKRMVSATYRAVEGDDHRVWSRDETRVVDVTPLREVELSCTVDLRARNWKERVVFSFSDPCSD